MIYNLEFMEWLGHILLIFVYKIFNNLCAIKPCDLFNVNNASRTRGHKYKISVPMAVLEVRRRFFSHRVVHWWNLLRSDTVEAPSLELFKKFLHRDLGDELFKFQD